MLGYVDPEFVFILVCNLTRLGSITVLNVIFLSMEQRLGLI